MSDSLVHTEARELGPGLRVGPIGFGCWRLVAMSPAEARERVEAALDSGLNLVDTADVYGLDWGGDGFGAVEALLGRVLADAPELRERMVLAGKGGIRPGVPYDSSREGLVAACEASLRRLGTECIDVYQIHRPDLYTHPAEVAEALSGLRDAGKIREAGVSNHTPAQTEALQAHLPFPLVSTQPEFSVAHLDPMRDGTFDLCMRTGLTPLVWSPLGGGRIVSRQDFSHELATTLDRLAKREGAERATLALAFVLAHPARPVPIVGTMDVGRIRRAPQALSVRLARDDVYAIVQASEGEPLP